MSTRESTAGGPDRDRPVSASRWAQARRLFEHVAELPGDERDVCLDTSCAGDPALRRDVEALLRADAATGVLDAPLATGAELLLDGAQVEAVGSGARIGAWRLLRELGRGGMGVVWLAERDEADYQQRVALKLIRGSLVSGWLESRFLRERQILARLQHPGIARLVDGGFTAERQPWLAMEYVEGATLTGYAAATNADLRRRIDLFLEVCDAVQYAHRQFVVHCDLKPANILVTGEGRVRLLDFGVARMLDDAGEGSGLTRLGVLLLTPEYAAPELLRGESPSTATDVFGLGAVLYELLSGQRIRELASPALDELHEAVRRGVLPLAEHPGLTRRQRRELGGDLQTIVQRALAPERDRRYATVDAFADDLRRWLAHRPVIARPDTAAYRLRKYVRRHRLGVAAAAACCTLLALGLAGTLWQAEQAEREADRATAMSGFLRELFTAVDPDEVRGRTVTARELLDTGAARIDGLDADPDVRTDALTTLGELYFALGEFGRAETMYRQAGREAIAAFGPDDSRLHVVQARLAYLLTDIGRHAEAEALLDKLATVDRSNADEAVLAQVMDALAHLRYVQGRHAEALELRRELLALNTRLHGARSPEVAESLVSLGANELDLENHAEAERLFTEALALQRGVDGDDHPDVANTLGLLGSLELRRGDLDAAEQLQREVLAIRVRTYGPGHPDVALSLDQIALTLQRRGELEASIDLLERSLAIRRRAFGAEHSMVADTLTNLATAAFRAGRFEDATAGQREALDIYRAVLDENHPRVANALSNLGVMLRQQGQYGEAYEALERSLVIRRALFDEEHTEVGVSLLHLSILDRLAGRPADAELRGRAALAIFEARLPAGHPRITEARANIAAISPTAARE